MFSTSMFIDLYYDLEDSESDVSSGELEDLLVELVRAYRELVEEVMVTRADAGDAFAYQFLTEIGLR